MSSTTEIECETLRELLLDYASGATNDATSLALASYLTLCPEARAHFRNIEKIGAAIFEHCCELESMKKESLSHVLNQIDRIEKNSQLPKSTQTDSSHTKNIPVVFEDCKLPQAISVRIRDNNQQDIKWKKILPGIELYKVPIQDSHEEAYLIRMKPGKKMIPHSHKGKEITLVLEGAFSDETGTYKRGDIVIHDQSSSHSPQADQRLGCTVLSIMDGPIQIKASFSFFKFFIRT